MKKSILLNQITTLRRMKKESNADGSNPIQMVTGYSNIWDLMLLPLYYCWEYHNYGTLNDLNFENYLQRAYRAFCRNFENLTRQLICMLRQFEKSNILSKKEQLFFISLNNTYNHIQKNQEIIKNKKRHEN